MKNGEINNMRSQYYFRCKDYIESNIEDLSSNLIANCTGVCALAKRFVTDKPDGRVDYYLQYLISGNMLIKIDGETKIMRPGQIIFYYPNTHYHYEFEETNEVVYFWVHFTGSEAENLIKKYGIPNKQLVDIGINEDILNNFKMMFKEFILRDNCFFETVAARLTDILVLVNRSMKQRNLDDKFDNKRILRSLKFIHMNYNTNITLKQLAELERSSISTFRALFQKCTGIPPIEYQIRLRINRACDLLIQTDLSIHEIAESIGYMDSLYFCRIFKKKIGMSPTSYRAVKTKY